MGENICQNVAEHFQMGQKVLDSKHFGNGAIAKMFVEERRDC